MKKSLFNACLTGSHPRFLSGGLAALLLFSGNLSAANVKLAWDATPSSSVGGYTVSYGQTSGKYTSSVDVGDTTSYTVSNLQEGATYYVAVKAYDLAKTTESAYSNETNTTIPVTEAITADFTVSKTSGPANLVVDFKPITSGTVTNWKWDFPGSFTSTVRHSTPKEVIVTYPNPGTYTVSLTAEGPSGSAVKTKPDFITVTAPTPVEPPPPVAPSPPVEPTPVEPPPSDDGLVAAYGFEEGSGTRVVDASAHGNDGTIKEAVRIAKGRYGKALSFDGLNDWVTVKHSDSLDLSTGLTLEAWVYPKSLTNGGKTLILKETFGGAVYNLYANEDANLPISSFYDGRYRVISGSNQLPAKQWTHLVATYDGSVQRLYVNGVEVAKKNENSVIYSSSGKLRIGGNSLWGEFFKGYIDEVRIYNRALTEAEVNNNLATPVSAFRVSDSTVELPPAVEPTPPAELPPAVEPTPSAELPPTVEPTPPAELPPSGIDASSDGLVAAYGFEEGSGTKVVDASGHGNHGTIKGAVRITKGHYGKALSFDGLNDWVTVKHSDSLDLSTGLTLEAWVYPKSLTLGGKTVILKESFGGAVYNLYANEDTNRPISSFYDGSYRVISGSKQLPANQWTHLVVTYDGAVQRLYVNGVEVARENVNGVIYSSSGKLRIGGNSLWGEFFKGYIDEVRIYNRALTETEVNNNLATPVNAPAT